MTTAKAPAKKKTIARPPAHPLVGPQRRSRNIDMPMPQARPMMATKGTKAVPVRRAAPPMPPRVTPQQTQRAAGKSIVDQILGGIGDRWREMTSGGSNSQFPGGGGIGDYLKRQGH